MRRRQWHPTPVLLPGKSHGWRSLEGCSPWGRWGSDTTERLHFHFSLSCIGVGNGKPFQCSYLENPRGGGAWWAAVYGVAQSRTRLKPLSSSSSGGSSRCLIAFSSKSMIFLFTFFYSAVFKILLPAFPSFLAILNFEFLKLLRLWLSTWVLFSPYQMDLRRLRYNKKPCKCKCYLCCFLI